MRFRVDLRHGYVSYDERDEVRARELFRTEGIRLRLCRDIFDEGTVIAGIEAPVDFRKAAAA